MRQLAVLALALVGPDVCMARVSYVARFSLERDSYLLGEPVFATFSIRNTGRKTFVFSYRTPRRALNEELEQEPRFAVVDESGVSVPDPATRPCGGGKGSVVYGSVTLPPGHTHTERWLLNQWARFSRPGRYQIRAERRLPLVLWEEAQSNLSARPAGFALAINELRLELLPATESQLTRAFQPYLDRLSRPESSEFQEAVLAVSTLPRSYFLEKLIRLTALSGAEHEAERQQALEGLARLGTTAAWRAVLEVARGGEPATPDGSAEASARAGKNLSLRAHAILLLAEKGDATLLPPLIDMLSRGPEQLRGDVLRALGYFRHPRANQVLFENLRSSNASDRVNAILGLKNLESRDVIPALMAMLSDSDSQVRQVAHFALVTLTGQGFILATSATGGGAARVAEQWRAWWRKQAATFSPLRQPACRDW